MGIVYRERVANLLPGMLLYMGKNKAPVNISYIEACSGARKGVGKTHINERMCFDNAGYVEIYVPAKAAEAAKVIRENREKESSE